MSGGIRVCVVCGRPYVYGRANMLGRVHNQLVENLVREFGEYKKIVDAETGLAYRVPNAIDRSNFTVPPQLFYVV